MNEHKTVHRVGTAINGLTRTPVKNVWGGVALFFALLCPGSTGAQTLDSCNYWNWQLNIGPACDCSVSGSSSYDGCDAFPGLFQSLVGSDDPDDLNNAANISAGWEGDVLHVTVDATDPLVAVLPAPSNGGHWETASALNSYLSDLFDVTVDVTDGDMEFAYEQEGIVARWDDDSNSWASNQLGGNLLFSAISGPDGEFSVADYEMELALTSGCDTESDGEFEGTQCSQILELDEVGCTGTCDCSDPHECFPPLAYFATSALTDFALSTGPYLRFTYWNDGIQYQWRRMQVLATEADMENVYYDVSGNATNLSPEYPNTEYDTDATSSGYGERYGVCGFGEAYRLTRELYPITGAGSAPSLDSQCESDLEGLQ